MRRRLFVGFGVALALVGVLAAALWLWEQRPVAIDVERYERAAQNYEVQIYRDRHGIPHLLGDTDADAAFGLAYAHAEDDFETIRDVIIAIRGELASYRGPSAAPGDYLVRLMRVWSLLDARYDRDLSPESRTLAQAYADGINLYAARHPKALLHGFLPVTGQDVAAGFIFKTPLFYGLDAVLREITGEARARPIAEPPQALRRGDGSSWGSNAIAVAPDRSNDSATRLWINSHQPLTGPVSWYEAHLLSNEGLDVYGGTFPGSPVILHGFNRSLGWANTVNRPDLADVYVLTVNPDNPNQYLLDGEWREFERDTARIEVKLFGALRWTFERPLLRSVHGPVLQTEHGTYALRYVGMNEVRQLDQYYALNRAGSFDEFMDAMRIHALPSINYTYADDEGNIAYIYNARFPRRAPGWDWRNYLAGDRSDLIWNEIAPFDEVPMVLRAESGLVGNANHTPFRATDGPDNPKPEDHPASWGIEQHMTNRGLRLLELWGGDDAITRDEMIRYKFDHRYSEHSRQAQATQRLLEFDFSKEPPLRQAQEVLRAWDFGTNAENRNAALAVLTLHDAFRDLNDRTALPADERLRESLREASEWLLQHHETLTPAWGDVNRLRRGPVDLPVSGAPDVLRAIEGERQPDGTLTATHGDGFMTLVEWDSDGSRRAWAAHQYGSHVSDPFGQHATDQMQAFINEELREVPLTVEAIEVSAESRTNPVTE